MISVNDVSLAFGKQKLFNEVNIAFSNGNCYGLIGANGSGKSTFLKILNGEIESDTGNVNKLPDERIAMLKQDHFAFDEFTVMDTVIMGHQKLYHLMAKRDALYAKPDFSEKDGLDASELESELADLNCWEAESEAGILLAGLRLDPVCYEKKMSTLEGQEKVRVLLAQALFGNPDILLLDEPTNHLDLESVSWLEEFLNKFENTVIVVSHDRHFLNKVCTHIADIDFGKIKVYTGNYQFWIQASELMIKQKQDINRKKEDKANELKSFISRFSSNASKARQATSRKKLLEKLTIEDIPVSSRKPPYIDFKPERACGKSILKIANLSKMIDGEQVISDFSLHVHKGDKIAFLGNALSKTTLFKILMDEETPDQGSFSWGETITTSYFRKDHTLLFQDDISLIDWLRQFSDDTDERYVRGFLGRMLFTGDESLKKINVLSGGEKVRCLLSKMMLSKANVMIFDEPTNHLDLEAITSINNSLIGYSGALLFTSHDHQFIETVANRIIEFTPNGFIDKMTTLDLYLNNPDIKKLRDNRYKKHLALTL